jgi:hypothetical protein
MRRSAGGHRKRTRVRAGTSPVAYPAGPASQWLKYWNVGRSPVNTDELEHALYEAERRVLKIQAKLHRWARDDPHRRFDDLFNLVADPGFLLVAWERVRGNKGARTAGVDGRTTPSIALRAGAGEFLGALRSQLKDRSFCEPSSEAG